MKRIAQLIWITLSVACATPAGARGLALQREHQDCTSPFHSSAPPILQKDFPTGLSLSEMNELVQRMLFEGKRLEYRGFRKDGVFVVPHISTQESGVKNPDAYIEIPEYVVQAISAHVSAALKEGYAKHPFMADIGHGHVVIPEKKFKEWDKRKDYSTVNALKETFRDGDFQILYHASENLTYKGDAEVEFLRKNRNIVGSMKKGYPIHTIPGSGTPNSASSVPGMSDVGIVYMSVTHTGCVPFNYQGKDLFLDISTTGPTQKPSPPVDSE